MKPHAIVEFRLKGTPEGGRQGAFNGQFFGCVLFVDGEAFDCRLILDGEELRPAERYTLPVAFLRPDLVLSKLAPGKGVTLWEGREIGAGHVVRLI